MPDVPQPKFKAPKLPAVLALVSKAAFIPGATLRKLIAKDLNLVQILAQGMDIGCAIFDHVELEKAKLTQLIVNDATFKHCGLANTDCSDGSFNRIEFTDGRMTGWDANSTILEDVMFKGCKLDMANFRASKLKRVRFSDCILIEADFTMNAELEDVEFQDCLLEKAQFSNCTMERVDFRSSQLIEISGWSSLKGATVDSVQLTAAAPYLAYELGIRVED